MLKIHVSLSRGRAARTPNDFADTHFPWNLDVIDLPYGTLSIAVDLKLVF